MECYGSNRKDCGSCTNCKDMKKFGGQGKKKQKCIHRVCTGKAGMTNEGENIGNTQEGEQKGNTQEGERKGNTHRRTEGQCTGRRTEGQCTGTNPTTIIA